ncbi:MAG: hypothetical protein WHX53_15890, partial [Anaerolineae bacterium]
MDQFNLQIARVPREWIEKYAALATATVHEASGRQGAMTHDIRPVAPGLRLCGSALTVRCQAADNLTLHAAVALAQPGDVLVADVGHVAQASGVAVDLRTECFVVDEPLQAVGAALGVDPLGFVLGGGDD